MVKEAVYVSDSKLDMTLWAEREQSAELARKASSELQYELQALTAVRKIPDTQYNPPAS